MSTSTAAAAAAAAAADDAALATPSDTPRARSTTSTISTTNNNPRNENPIQTCTDCFTGTIHTAQPTGHLETIHNVPTYITRGAATSNSTIIFLPDGFGFNLVNNKLLADQYAARTGLRVLMPNLLPNGGVPLAMMRWSEDLAGAGVPWWNLVSQARRVWAGCRLMTVLIPFGFKVRRLYPTVLAYVRAVRASLPLGAKLGIAGFCLGGYWSSWICSEAARDDNNHHQQQQQQQQRQHTAAAATTTNITNTTSSYEQGDNSNNNNGDGSGGTAQHAHPLIDAHFTAHPSSVGPDDAAVVASRFRVPWCMALGDKDMMMSVDQAHKVEAKLREVYRDDPDRLQVVLYPNCGHGFALRADPNKPQENEGSERALEQAVAWFRKYL